MFQKTIPIVTLLVFVAVSSYGLLGEREPSQSNKPPSSPVPQNNAASEEHIADAVGRESGASQTGASGKGRLQAALPPGDSGGFASAAVYNGIALANAGYQNAGGAAAGYQYTQLQDSQAAARYFPAAGQNRNGESFFIKPKPAPRAPPTPAKSNRTC